MREVEAFPCPFFFLAVGQVRCQPGIGRPVWAYGFRRLATSLFHGGTRGVRNRDVIHRETTETGKATDSTRRAKPRLSYHATNRFQQLHDGQTNCQTIDRPARGSGRSFFFERRSEFSMARSDRCFLDRFPKIRGSGFTRKESTRRSNDRFRPVLAVGGQANQRQQDGEPAFHTKYPGPPGKRIDTGLRNDLTSRATGRHGKTE